MAGDSGQEASMPRQVSYELRPAFVSLLVVRDAAPSYSVAPARKGVLRQMGVGVSVVIRDFKSNPGRPQKYLVLGTQLDLSNDESGARTVKFINLPNV
jgi:hypothetical protein